MRHIRRPAGVAPPSAGSMDDLYVRLGIKNGAGLVGEWPLRGEGRGEGVALGCGAGAALWPTFFLGAGWVGRPQL